MKKLFSGFLLMMIANLASAQIENPVTWTYSAIKKADKTYELTITATIAKPWHLYSQTTPDGGPVPTSFTFKANPLITLDGNVNEAGKLKTYHDKNFGVDVKYFSDKVVFTQNIKLKAALKTNLSGTIEFMVCNDEKCLPPKTVPFDIKLQ